MIGDFVTSLTKNDDLFIVQCENNIYAAKTVLIASGTKEKKLALPKEDKFLLMAFPIVRYVMVISIKDKIS